MKRWIGIVLMAGLLTGCNINKVSEAKVESYKRWNTTRAQMLYGVAEEHLKVGQLKQAAKKCQEAIALVPSYAEARMLLAQVYIEQGRYNDAEVQLEKAGEVVPKSPKVAYLMGVAQEKNNQLREALASYRRAHTLDPDNISAVMAATEVMISLNRLREAQLYVESYLPMAQENPGMYELAGRIAMMSDENEKAARYFQQACDLDFKNIAYRETLARCQYKAGEYQDTIGTLKGLMKSSDYKADDWVYTMLGDCYLFWGRYRDARDMYQVVADRTPAAPMNWTNLAKATLGLKDYARAILSARQALELDPGRLDATLLLGCALIRSGQTSKAIRELTPAAALHKDDATIHCLLGWAHSLNGDDAEAKRYYGAAVQLDPNNALAKELRSGGGRLKFTKAD